MPWADPSSSSYSVPLVERESERERVGVSLYLSLLVFYSLRVYNTSRALAIEHAGVRSFILAAASQRANAKVRLQSGLRAFS